MTLSWWIRGFYRLVADILMMWAGIHYYNNHHELVAAIYFVVALRHWPRNDND